MSTRLLLGLTLLVTAVVRPAFASDNLASTELFAGLDTSQFSQMPVTSARTLRSELVGIVVDGKEIAMELVYREGDRLYLPAQLLGRLGISGRNWDGDLVLVTPGGEVRASRAMFRRIEGGLYFSEALLRDVLQIQWEFSPEKYAITMTLPWWQTDQQSVRRQAGQTARGVDVAPSSVGLTQIRLDHTHVHNDAGSYGQSDLLLRGRLLDGVWRGEVRAQENRPTRAEDYYWLRDFEQFQALVGNQQVLINPLLPAIENTGAQVLYSSEGIEFDPYHDQSRSQYIRRFGIPVKDIEGVAQPGAIAELRVNERPVARIRVNLDGTFRFRDVRNNSLQFQTTRVHILDQRSMVELEVQDFSRTPIDLLLDQGESVLFAGGGANGNPLDPLLGTSGAAGFGLARYGVSDWLTLEAGLQSAIHGFHQTVGATASLGRNWAGTASFGHADGATGHSVELYGRSDRWHLTARAQEFGDGFRNPSSLESSTQQLRYEYWVSSAVSVGLEGRSLKTATGTSEYILPGASWRYRGNYVKLWPDLDGEYRLDVRTTHRQRDWFEFVHSSTGSRAEYRYFRNQNHEIFGRLDHREFDGSTIAEFGSIWYPNRFDDRSQLRGSVLGGDGGFGYRFLWQTTVLPGLFSNLELRQEPVATEFYDPGLQVRWTLSVDLSIAGGRPVPARNNFVQGRLGSIAGRITLPDGQSIASEGIDQVSILIDGRPRTAILRGKHFFVRNLPPGIYEVELGSEYLPMNLSPRQASYRVKVGPAATSTVDFVVQPEYGLAGQVTGPDEGGIASVLVKVVDDHGTALAQTWTDSYGYFRVAGLPPGEYDVRIAESQGVNRTVRIVDAFLFDVDLRLPGS